MYDNKIKDGKKLYLRNAFKDEYWLQDRIVENPSRLELGDLIAVDKERRQSSGGKLDILLKDPADNSMYEVEVMLGATDPSHIIRTIEYWDIEKRRYPQRQHFAVLIAESFNRRYFNVIQVLSLGIPMIAIQADLIEAEGELILNFTKILDIYEEPLDDEFAINVTEGSWKEDAPWTLQAARDILNIVNEGQNELALSYTQAYIGISSGRSFSSGGRNAYWLNRRAQPKSYLNFREKEDERAETIKALLDNSGISYSYNKWKEFALTIDSSFVKNQKDLIKKIHEIRFTGPKTEDGYASKDVS